MRSSVVFVSLLVASSAFAKANKAPPAAPPHDTALMYVRQSAEYDTLAREQYTSALGSALAQESRLPKGTAWAVVLDVDETTLDNSQFQVDLAGTPFDPTLWNAWIAKQAAPPVPGVVDFIAGVRAAGGHVAYVTNRSEKENTTANLTKDGLFAAGDLVCPGAGGGPSKRERREQVRTGKGDCSWAGTPVDVLVYLGDQMVDFPESGEDPDAGQGSPWGQRWFLLPNPMYGAWTTAPTRAGYVAPAAPATSPVPAK